jgi:hypothetical protein
VPRSRQALIVVGALTVVVLGGVVIIVGGMTGSSHPASTAGPGRTAGAAGPGGQAGGAALCNSQRLAVDGGRYNAPPAGFHLNGTDCKT